MRAPTFLLYATWRLLLFYLVWDGRSAVLFCRGTRAFCFFILLPLPSARSIRGLAVLCLHLGSLIVGVPTFPHFGTVPSLVAFCLFSLAHYWQNHVRACRRRFALRGGGAGDMNMRHRL